MFPWRSILSIRYSPDADYAFGSDFRPVHEQGKGYKKALASQWHPTREQVLLPSFESASGAMRLQSVLRRYRSQA